MSYEIRAMSLGEILDTGFRLVRDEFVPLVGIAATVQVPVAVLGALTQKGEFFLPALFGLLILGLGGSPIVLAATTFAVGEVYLGRSITVGGSLRAAIGVILPLAGTMLLYYFGVLLGLLLLIVPGIFLVLSWLLAWPIMVLEGVFGPAALGRSYELMRGHRLRGLGATVVSWLILAIVTNIFQLVFSFVPMVGPVFSGLASAVGTAYVSAVIVVLYFDVRCRKEAFDLEHLAQLVAAQPAPA